MKENYKQTKKEVLGEMIYGAKQYFSRDNLRDVGSRLKQNGKDLAQIVLLTTLLIDGPIIGMRCGLDYLDKKFPYEDKSAQDFGCYKGNASSWLYENNSK